MFDLQLLHDIARTPVHVRNLEPLTSRLADNPDLALSFGLILDYSSAYSF